MLDKISTTSLVCEPFHADFTGRLTLSMLGNHLLNCTEQHATARGFGMSNFNDESYTWVLSRLAIEFDALPQRYETFEIDTWVEKVYRLFTDRNYAIRNAEGKTIGYGRSTWALIGIQSRKPVDLTSLHNGLLLDYTCPEQPCPIDKPERIKVTAEQPECSIVAKYSDIDINGHVNSIRYISHVLDLFSLDFYREHPLRRFEIAYVTESYCGDVLDFFVDHSDPTHCQVELRQRKDATVVCRCKLVFQ